MSSIDTEHGDGDGADRREAVTRRPPTKRARQKAETRQRLLDAATEVFLESAPVTASLDEVAARAGVSRPTLFFHFGSRAELMVELFRHHMERFRSRARTYRPGEFRPFLEAYLRSQRTPKVRLLHRLSDVIYGTNPDAPVAVFWNLVAELEGRLETAGIPADEAHERALVLAYAVTTVARRAAYDEAPEAEMDEFVQAACRLMLAPPTKPEGMQVGGDGSSP